ncbi:MAG: hypothetical protein ACRYGF_02830 [Janthinobacterium lividum]
MADQKVQSSPFSVGDSISLISFLFAVVVFVISPPLWLRALLLLAAVPGIFLGLKTAYWTAQWSFTARTATASLLSSAILLLGAVQINEQLALQHHQTLGQIAQNAVARLLQLRKSSKSAAIGWMISGALLLWCAQQIKKLAPSWSRKATVYPKGFLDYKLQTESAIKGLSPAIAPLSQLMDDVTTMTQTQKHKIEAAAAKSTERQVAVIRATSKKLDRITRNFVDRGRNLERLAISLQQGLLGWFTWAQGNPSRLDGLRPLQEPLNGMLTSMESALNSTGLYISSIEGIRNISADMNGAVERHLSAIEEIQRINKGLHSACMAALDILHS